MKTKTGLVPLKTVIFVLILICVGIYCIASGIWGITENHKKPLDQVFTEPFVKGDLFEGSVNASSPAFLQINHKINYIIPAGKEYYYLILSDDNTTAIAIRAGKNFSKSFDSYWRNTREVIIKGRIKELSDKAESRLNEVKESLLDSGLECNIIDQYYIDTIGGNLYKMRIAVGICIIIVIFLAYVVIRKNLSTYEERYIKLLSTIILLITLVILILGIYLMVIS